MYYDILIFIGLGISLIAQLIVTSSYNKYKKVLNNKDLTGYEVARRILDKNKEKNQIVISFENSDSIKIDILNNGDLLVDNTVFKKIN